MPASTWNLEWLNHNSQRAYPLFEEASRTDQSGSFKIPDGLILAMYLPVHAGLDVQSEKFFVYSVAVFAIGINISIGYDDGSTSPPIVATAVIPVSTHTEYKSYALPGAGDFDDTVGKIVIGDVRELAGLPPGQYLFSPAAGQLDTDVVRPIIRGVSSLTLVNGGERSDRLYGDIELIAGSNIRLTPQTVGGRQQVRIDAIDGEGLNDQCVCEGDTQAPCIRTINGIPPTPAGNFVLLGSNCIDIDGITNGLKFVDTCSDPCCGCAELEAVTRSLERFGEASTTLTNFLNRLESQVTTMSMVVLGSRINDQGCLASGG
jgi:hypothetical protein